MTYVPAIYCSELYSDKLNADSENYDASVANAFKLDWICPNLTEIELFGDPYFEIHNNGKSFNMIVNSCLEAQK